MRTWRPDTLRGAGRAGSSILRGEVDWAGDDVEEVEKAAGEWGVGDLRNGGDAGGLRGNGAASVTTRIASPPPRLLRDCLSSSTTAAVARDTLPAAPVLASSPKGKLSPPSSNEFVAAAFTTTAALQGLPVSAMTIPSASFTLFAFPAPCTPTRALSASSLSTSDWVVSLTPRPSSSS